MTWPAAHLERHSFVALPTRRKAHPRKLVGARGSLKVVVVVDLEFQKRNRKVYVIKKENETRFAIYEPSQDPRNPWQISCDAKQIEFA